MPVAKFVEVRILRNNQPLHEYPVPVGEAAPNDQHVSYVEAVAGERFGIMLRFHAGYRVDRAVSIMSELSLDGETFLSHPIWCDELFTHKGVLAQARDSYHDHCRINFSRSSAKLCYYSFGALELSETVDKSIKYDQERLDNLGEIRITIYRGGSAVYAEPHVSGPVQVYDRVPAKGMKGRLLKNNVRFDDTVDDIPVPTARCYPLPGKAGRKTTFVFRYRSKKILKQLGCIERSPSPEPDHALMLERQEEMIKEAKEKARKANLKILELEQRLAQSEEFKGVKRKREEDDDDNDEIEVMAPPPKKRAVVVDLTEDDD